MLHNEPAHKKPAPTLMTDFFSGILSGTIYTTVFHPWDRAFYLSIKGARPLFIRSNFYKPYHGYWQSVCQRAFLGSAYYLVQGQMRSHAAPYLREHTAAPMPFLHLLTGVAAGIVHGFMTNTPALVRAHTWGNEAHSFVSSVKSMYQAAGHQAFTTGLSVSMLRDAVYGGSYEVFRHLFRKKIHALQTGTAIESLDLKFPCDALAASIATVIASPLTYVRYQKYATPPTQQPPSMAGVMASVWQESSKQNKSHLERLSFFQTRLGIGNSVMRAGIGMAFGQKVFDEVRNWLCSR